MTVYSHLDRSHRLVAYRILPLTAAGWLVAHPDVLAQGAGAPSDEPGREAVVTRSWRQRRSSLPTSENRSQTRMKPPFEFYISPALAGSA
jgi:hypothetical protein